MKSVLDDVRPENFFILKNGEVLKNIAELASVIENLDDEIYFHHVNSEKNDFANWAGHVLGDNSLKNELVQADTKKQFLNILNSRINKTYSNNLNNDFLGFDFPDENESLNASAEQPFTNMSMAEAVSIHQEIPPEKASEEEKKDEMTNTMPFSDNLDELPMELPPDMPPDIGPEGLLDEPVDQEEPEEKSETNEEAKVEEPEEKIQVEEPEGQDKETTEGIVEDISEESQNNDTAESSKDLGIENKENKETETALSQEEVVEIREIELVSLGLKEIDKHFPKGIPKICNMMFIGEMSTGKTLVSLNLLLAKAKQGEKTVYISLHDSEEKIINIMKSLDDKILDYVNSGNIIIKKLNPFEIVTEFIKADTYKKFEKCCKFLEFLEVLNPNLVVVDSLSSLELSFADNKLDYRHYVDRMFKYFEKLGVLGILIKELKTEDDINKEFFENLLADTIIYFYKPKKSKRSKSRLIKEYPMAKSKKGFFSFFKKKR